MQKYIITKFVPDKVTGDIGYSDLLINMVFPSRLQAIWYVNMYIEDYGYEKIRGQVDFPITGNIVVKVGPQEDDIEEYQLVSMKEDAEAEKILKELDERISNLTSKH